MTERKSRSLIGLLLAGALMAPATSARADSLESEFDRIFPARSSAIVSLPQPGPLATRVQPGTNPARPVLTTRVRPFIASSAPVSYGSSFEAQLAQMAESSKGRIGVAAIDLATGRTINVLGDMPFPMASTSKVAIAATFLEGVDRGRFRLDGYYPLMVPVRSKKFSTAAAPVVPGTMLTGQQLIERALINSDNAATDALLAAVGGPTAVNRWLRTTGNAGLRLDRDIATLVRDDGEFNPATMIDERDSSTPLAMARLLAGLYEGRWLSAESRAVLITTMERCRTGKRRMRALLPAEARVAHKTGTLSNTSSDVGLVRTPDGQVYAMAIYVTGQGNHAARDARIATIARTIYDGYRIEGPGFSGAVQ